MKNPINLTGTKVIKLQHVAKVEQHIDNIDMTNASQAETDAVRNAQDALDAHFGFEAWIVENIEQQGSKMVTTFSPIGTTATRLFGAGEVADPEASAALEAMFTKYDIGGSK